MNIQIFGKSKCFDTKKAERFFKERNIPFQRIALESKGLSRGELLSVKSAVGGLDNMIDEKSKESVLIRYLAYEEQREEAGRYLYGVIYGEKQKIRERRIDTVYG